MKTVGMALIDMLAHLGTEHVFGIPGVHTVELYRGLAASRIRHITPRHEQGAAFMADGYARASGRPGVCLLITGPGLTNALTAMAQAMQDSIPMLVITGVNPVDSFGKGQGLLHELPDQQGLIRALTPHSHSLRDPADLPGLLASAFELFASARPGPVHIEIPIDLMSAPMPDYQMPAPVAAAPAPDHAELQSAATAIAASQSLLILAGGGSVSAAADVMALATQIDAPVISTANARAAMGRHPLHVSASASLPAIRDVIAEADLVVALGTEFGPTDYDVYVDGGFPRLQRLIRVDIDAAQLTRGPECEVALNGSVANSVPRLADLLPNTADRSGAARCEAMLRSVAAQADKTMHSDLAILEALVEELPGCAIVGDSTQLVYSGNLFLPHSALPDGWFNAATGFGTLGYAPPAAIGAALARPDQPVVCLVGDGGLQFSIAELASAVEAGVPVLFVVWNNSGYREIESYMRAADITPISVTPVCPDLMAVAQAYDMPGRRADTLPALRSALRELAALGRPAIVECIATQDQIWTDQAPQGTP